MWTDGETDMTKLIVAFRNFAKAPKKKKGVFLKQSMFFGQSVSILNNFPKT